MLHGSSTTWFQTSRYCRAKAEFNSINCVRYGPDTAVARRLKRASDKLTAFLLRTERFFFAVAMWPVTGQGFQNTKWPAVSLTTTRLHTFVIN